MRTLRYTWDVQDADISIRKQALGLLFAMSDSTNAMSIVQELLTYLVPLYILP